MPLAYISVNKHTILRNARTGSNYPPIAVRTTKSGVARYVQRLKINGPCEMIYSPDKPLLKCGARLVVVTDAANVECQPTPQQHKPWTTEYGTDG